MLNFGRCGSNGTNVEIHIVGVAAAAAAVVVMSSVDTGGPRYPIRGDLPW